MAKRYPRLERAMLKEMAREMDEGIIESLKRAREDVARAIDEEGGDALVRVICPPPFNSYWDIEARNNDPRWRRMWIDGPGGPEVVMDKDEVADVVVWDEEGGFEGFLAKFTLKRSHDTGKVFWVDFRLCEYRSEDDDGPMFQTEDLQDFTREFDDADESASGDLKWDGCSEVSMQNHTCSLAQRERLHKRVMHCLRTAASYIPDFEGEDF